MPTFEIEEAVAGFELVTLTSAVKDLTPGPLELDDSTRKSCDQYLLQKFSLSPWEYYFIQYGE